MRIISSKRPDKTTEPWQLLMFERTLKKQQKLNTLIEVLKDVSSKRCLLITCGDNNGALNWHFKQLGGDWTWADFEDESIKQISSLTGDPVEKMAREHPVLAFQANTFDIIVTIDVHEHLEEPKELNIELERLVKTGGTVIVTTPNGNETKLANRIKKMLGMHPEDYGHVVAGYDIPELETQLVGVGLRPYVSSSYSRFFTEMMELVINYAYVNFLSRRSKAKVEIGQIAPQNEDQLRSVKKSYQLYSRIYPILRALSKLDVLDRSSRGYAVVVGARKI